MSDECRANPLRPYINGIQWEVKILPHHKMPGYAPDITVLGRCEFGTTLISLNEELAPEVFKRAAIHEMTHAFMYSYGVDQVKHTEETVCDFMAAFGKTILNYAGLISDYRFDTHERLLERMTP